MSIQELKEKKEYLQKLGMFTSVELELIKREIILANTHNTSESKDALSDEEKISMLKKDLEVPKGILGRYHYCDELIGIEGAYRYIIHTINEESSFPYPHGYRHQLDEQYLMRLNGTILDSYRIYEPYEKGNYRKGTNKDKLGDRILPNRELFIQRLIDLLKWYHETDCDFFTKLAVFHLKFEEDIHPFYDGNGRTGRMVMNLELAREGYPMIGLKYDDVAAYNRAFQLYSESQDYEFMRTLILKNVDQQIDRNILIKKG